jgi:hypothetical protein
MLNIEIYNFHLVLIHLKTTTFKKKERLAGKLAASFLLLWKMWITL